MDKELELNKYFQTIKNVESGRHIDENHIKLSRTRKHILKVCKFSDLIEFAIPNMIYILNLKYQHLKPDFWYKITI